MPAMFDPAPTASSEMATPCRVCGQLIALNVSKCSRCGTPKLLQRHESREVGGGDFALAWLSGILALCIGIPLTFALSAPLWNRGWTWQTFPVALMVTSLNIGLIGVPIGMTLWRWRDRAIDGESQHNIPLREYWQIQLLCLLPFATIGLFIGAFWIVVKYLSN